MDLTAVAPFLTAVELAGTIIVGVDVETNCIQTSSNNVVEYKPNADSNKCFRGTGGFRIDMTTPTDNYFLIDISELKVGTVFEVFLGLDSSSK